MARAGFYTTSHGRHRPCCGGRCLVAHVDSENNAVGASVSLIVVPTCAFAALVPLRDYFLLVALAFALLTLSLGYLVLALVTEPGILPPAPPDAPANGRGRGRVTHVIVHGEKVDLREKRAKMCRQTENCVEDFDHYCPWVGNAVGRRNYRYFVGFLVSVTGLCVVVGSASALRVASLNVAGLKNDDDAYDEEPSWKAIALAVLVVYTVVVFFSVGSLAVYHFRLVGVNQGSTRERHSQLQRLLSRPFSTRFG
jgi:palmitoyltransferase ZDHHC9/14/18